MLLQILSGYHHIWAEILAENRVAAMLGVETIWDILEGNGDNMSLWNGCGT